VSDFIGLIRPYIELLYFFAQIGIVVIAFYGLKQIHLSFKQISIGMEQVAISMEQVHLLKRDIDTRNQRMAVEKSIEFIDRFATRIFSLDEEFLKKAEGINLSMYKGEINDFNDSFSLNEKKIIVEKMVLGAYVVLNELELFAVAFTSGLGDEEIAYYPLGRAYCRMVQRYYDVICEYRKIDVGYINLIKLYETWSNKIKKEDVSRKMSELEKLQSSIPDSSITPIGR